MGQRPASPPRDEPDGLRAALHAEKVAHERTRSELALTEVACRHFVPTQFIKLLGASSITQARLGQHQEQALTVMFSDIRNFTTSTPTWVRSARWSSDSAASSTS